MMLCLVRIVIWQTHGHLIYLPGCGSVTVRQARLLLPRKKLPETLMPAHFLEQMREDCRTKVLASGFFLVRLRPTQR